MGEIAAFVQRTALALLLSVAPWAVPLESPTLLPGTETHVLLVYGVPLLIYIVVACVMLVRSTLQGVVALGALAAAAFGASYFDGVDGPLGLIVWIVAPMALATVGFALHELVSLVRKDIPQPPFVLAAFVLGGVNFWVTRDVVFTREGMLATVLATDPGNERAAVQMAELLRGEGEPARADKVLDACATLQPAGCLCVSADLRALDDRGGYSAAKKLAEANLPRCAATRLLRARYAEVLAAAGEPEPALALVDELRKTGPELAETFFAEARARRWKHDLDGATMAAREAVKRGRGLPASLFVAEIYFEKGEDVSARAELVPLLQKDGKHLRVLYLLGRIAQREKSFPEARVKYERVLELAPNNLDGHAALAALAVDEGNAVEALHHADRIALIAPDDSRPAAIRAAVAALGRRKK
jgi:tetratricopeptide (TPR) repeat protein